MSDRACADCVAGKYGAGGTITACTDCPANTYSTGAPGTTDFCESCATGSTSVAGSASCTTPVCLSQCEDAVKSPSDPWTCASISDLALCIPSSCSDPGDASAASDYLITLDNVFGCNGGGFPDSPPPCMIDCEVTSGWDGITWPLTCQQLSDSKLCVDGVGGCKGNELTYSDDHINKFMLGASCTGAVPPDCLLQCYTGSGVTFDDTALLTDCITIREIQLCLSKACPPDEDLLYSMAAINSADQNAGCSGGGGGDQPPPCMFECLMVLAADGTVLCSELVTAETCATGACSDSGDAAAAVAYLKNQENNMGCNGGGAGLPFAWLRAPRPASSRKTARRCRPSASALTRRALDATRRTRRSS